MKIEIVIFDTDNRRKLVTVEGRKVFEYAGYSFYSHPAYSDSYATSITEKTSGLSVFTQKGTMRYIVDMAKDVVMNAKNLNELIAKGVTSKQEIIVNDLFRGAGIIE